MSAQARKKLYMLGSKPAPQKYETNGATLIKSLSITKLNKPRGTISGNVMHRLNYNHKSDKNKSQIIDFSKLREDESVIKAALKIVSGGERDMRNEKILQNKKVDDAYGRRNTSNGQFVSLGTTSQSILEGKKWREGTIEFGRGSLASATVKNSLLRPVRDNTSI